MIPAGAKVYVATRPVDFRKGPDGFGGTGARHRRRSFSGGALRLPGRNARNEQHSAYSFRRATIAYRWHPLFGRTLQVSRNRRGKELTCIYTEERPDLARELPNWMFDERYCAGMSLGPPQISIEALKELAAVFAAGGKTFKPGSRSGPSKPREAIRAQKEKPGPKAARAGSRTAGPDVVPADPERKGTDRSVGRPFTRSDRRADDGRGERSGRRS